MHGDLLFRTLPTFEVPTPTHSKEDQGISNQGVPKKQFLVHRGKGHFVEQKGKLLFCCWCSGDWYNSYGYPGSWDGVLVGALTSLRNEARVISHEIGPKLVAPVIFINCMGVASCEYFYGPPPVHLRPQQSRTLYKCKSTPRAYQYFIHAMLGRASYISAIFTCGILH